MDRDADRDQNAQGPGIYWTRSHTQAEGYAYPAGYVYTATMKTTARRVLRATTRPSAALVERFIALAPEESRYYGLTNWDENPRRALRVAVQAYVESNDDLYTALVTVYHDFYGHRPEVFTEAMVRLGFDAYLHQLPEVDHLIVFNPEIIRVTDEERSE